MPLLDRSQIPLDPRRAWESFHSRWANSIVDQLIVLDVITGRQFNRHSCLRICVFIVLWTIAGGPTLADAGWKAGTGRVAITPKEPMWMAGYAARTKPSEGAVHDLWAKALAIEDPAGKRAILVTLDVCGIDRALSNRVRDALKSRHGLDRDRILLACSHTHSGPVVGTNLLTMYKIDAGQHRRIAEYAECLMESIVTASGQAIDRLEQSQLAWAMGRCGFE
jgi:neutral ceramidase